MTRDKDTSQDGWEEAREGENYQSDRPRSRLQRPRSDAGDTRARPRPRSGSANTNDLRDTSRKAYPPYQRPSQDDYEDSLEPPRPPSQRRPVPPRDDRDQATEPPVVRRRTHDFREEENSAYSQQQPQRPQRPRTTRQSRENVYARLRQRPRQSLNARDEFEDTPARTPRRTTNPEEEIEDTPVRTPRRITNPEEQPNFRPVRRAGTRTPSSTPRRAAPPRRRNVGSTLLIGCVGGVITIALIAGIVAFIFYRVLPTAFPGLGIGNSTFSDQPHSISLSVPPTITQVQTNNSTGNISVSVDINNTNGTTATLTYIRKVQASSSGNATSEFGRISVNAGNGNTASCPPASCLAISTTIPNPTLDAVDLTLVLPASVNRLPSDVTNTPAFTLNATTTIKGDITVQNFQGTVNIKASKQGNVSMQHGLLVAGSCLGTNIGTVTFNALLDVHYRTPLVPCTTSTSSDPHAWYEFKSEGGNVDATLNPSLNVILDANTNFGKLTSDFPLTPPSTPIPYCGTSPPSSTYFCGPLIPASTLPSAILKIDVSTGNINLHKAPGS